MSTPETTSAIMGRVFDAAQQGDEKATKQLLTTYRKVIRHAVLRAFPKSLERKAELEDLEQEVAIVMLGQIQGYQWNGQKAFHAWLRQIAHGVTTDELRKHLTKKRDMNAEVHDISFSQQRQDGPGMETQLERKTQLEMMDQWMQEIDPRRAQAIMLSTLGHSWAEIGEILETSSENARKLKERGVADLRSLQARSKPTASK